MADEPETIDSTDEQSEEPTAPSGDDIAALKKALAKANREAADHRRKLRTYEDADKTAEQRATGAEERASKAEERAMRLEVALAKGLTPAQAKRLVGSTLEELEADADDLLATFKSPDSGDKAPPSQQPKPALGGGADPTEAGDDDLDPKKLAAAVPRF